MSNVLVQRTTALEATEEFRGMMEKHYNKVLLRLERAAKRARGNPVAEAQVREAQVIYMREAYRFERHYDKFIDQFGPFFEREE